MIRVMVVWEDRFHDKLDLCFRRALRRHDPSDAPAPALFFDTAHGNGGFDRYIRRDWPKLRKGLPRGAPVDVLLCVADADRTMDCGVAEPVPAFPAPTAEWVARANRVWTDGLRQIASLESHRIFGRFLRWNQESLLIAAHDVDESLRRLGCRDAHIEAIRAHLRSACPGLLDTADAAFVDQYRKASRCFDDMLKAAGLSAAKGTTPRDDALDEASRRAIDRLCARVPDLAGLADLVRDAARMDGGEAGG